MGSARKLKTEYDINIWHFGKEKYRDEFLGKSTTLIMAVRTSSCRWLSCLMNSLTMDGLYSTIYEKISMAAALTISSSRAWGKQV